MFTLLTTINLLVFPEISWGAGKGCLAPAVQLEGLSGRDLFDAGYREKLKKIQLAEQKEIFINRENLRKKIKKHFTGNPNYNLNLAIGPRLPDDVCDQIAKIRERLLEFENILQLSDPDFSHFTVLTLTRLSNENFPEDLVKPLYDITSSFFDRHKELTAFSLVMEGELIMGDDGGIIFRVDDKKSIGILNEIRIKFITEALKELKGRTDLYEMLLGFLQKNPDFNEVSGNEEMITAPSIVHSTIGRVKIENITDEQTRQIRNELKAIGRIHFGSLPVSGFKLFETSANIDELIIHGEIILTLPALKEFFLETRGIDLMEKAI
ncbi:MAG: hypothetical protein KJ915_08495 [Candidatus Omnitrophica bacterium]|nr:hypothetical protein [Candidatus Omnitrophota bacterium]